MTVASILSPSMRDNIPYASSTVALTMGVVAAIVYLTVLSKRRRGYDKNSPGGSLPPGPTGVPLLGSLPFVSFELHTYFAGLAQTYGPVFSLRLGSKLCVVISSPSAAREALKDKDAIFASHDPSVAAFIATYRASDVAFTPDGPLWRTLRRVCVQELLSRSSVESLRESRRREVRRVVAELRSKAECEVEIREVVFRTTLAVLKSMMWGSGSGEEDEACAAAEFKELVDGILSLMEAPNISDYFPLLARWDIQGVARRMKRFTYRFDRIMDTVIERRIKHGADTGAKDFLQVLLELLERNDPNANLSVVHVKALLWDMIAAGTDTTYTTIEWAMAELLHSPDKMRIAQEELDAVVGKHRVVEESDIPQLPFLTAVIKEVLRLHPPAPFLIPRLPSESCTVHGYKVPKGAKVFVNAWAMHRDPANWDDPLCFKPERFMDATEEYDLKVSSFKYLPFGSGRRVCPGYILGERMVLYQLATFLHSFDWKLPEGIRLINLNDKFGLTMKKKEPLIVVPMLRLNSSELYAGPALDRSK